MSLDKNPPKPAEILLHQTEDGQTRLEVHLQEETVWLTQKRMAELFQKNVRTINEHIQNIFAESELVPESLIRNLRITADDGKIITCSTTTSISSSPVVTTTCHTSIPTRTNQSTRPVFKNIEL